MNITEKDQTRITRTLGKLRLKSSEHIQVGIEGVRDVEVVFILTEPTEGFAVRNNFQVRGIDIVLGKDAELFVAEIAAHHRDDAHVGKETRRDRKVRS